MTGPRIALPLPAWNTSGSPAKISLACSGRVNSTSGRPPGTTRTVKTSPYVRHMCGTNWCRNRSRPALWSHTAPRGPGGGRLRSTGGGASPPPKGRIFAKRCAVRSVVSVWSSEVMGGSVPPAILRVRERSEPGGGDDLVVRHGVVPAGPAGQRGRRAGRRPYRELVDRAGDLEPRGGAVALTGDAEAPHGRVTCLAQRAAQLDLGELGRHRERGPAAQQVEGHPPLIQVVEETGRRILGHQAVPEHGVGARPLGSPSRPRARAGGSRRCPRSGRRRGASPPRRPRAGVRTGPTPPAG